MIYVSPLSNRITHKYNDRYLLQVSRSQDMKSTSILCSQVEEVGDGNINYVYIVEGPRGALVVKQGLPYIRIDHSWNLTQVCFRNLFGRCILTSQLSNTLPSYTCNNTQLQLRGIFKLNTWCNSLACFLVIFAKF